MKPLFEVGEEVLVMSRRYERLMPTTVIKIVKAEMISNLGKIEMVNDGFYYHIDGSYKHNFNPNITTFAMQYELRKKHKPSDFDFNELMKEINDLVTV